MEGITTLPDPHDLENNESFFIYNVDDKKETIEVRRSNYKNWLIRKGTEDLIKGVNLTLIEAHWFGAIAKSVNEINSIDEFNKIGAETRKKSQRLGIPDLLSQLGERKYLKEPLMYEKNILSLNRLRNCLVHRNGIVSSHDIDNTDNNLMELKYKRLALTHNVQGGEVELTKPFKNEGQQINFKIDERSKTFGLNSKVELSFRDFNDFVFTCSIFGNELISKLIS